MLNCAIRFKGLVLLKDISHVNATCLKSSVNNGDRSENFALNFHMILESAVLNKQEILRKYVL